MFLEVLIAILLNTSNNESHLELKIGYIQIVVITCFVLISNVDIKKVESTKKIYP